MLHILLGVQPVLSLHSTLTLLDITMLAKQFSMVSLKLLYIAPTSKSPSVHIYNMDYKVPRLLLHVLYRHRDGSKSQVQTM